MQTTNTLSEANLRNKQWLRDRDQLWLENRLRVARHVRDLSESESPFDAQIILCCALGALAAAIWPGERIGQGSLYRAFSDILPNFAKTIDDQHTGAHESF